MIRHIIAALAFVSVAGGAFGQYIYERQRVTTWAGETFYDSSRHELGKFFRPEGVAFDKAGNMYVADTGNHVIRKVSPSKVVTTLAGWPGSAGAANGTGSAARFFSPAGVAVDAAGNVFVADSGNNAVRKISPGGVVTTVAGQLGQREGYVDGPGTLARFYSPQGVAVDKSGVVYVTDYLNDCIRKISPGGNVSTLAGMPRDHWGNVDGVGKDAWLVDPKGITMGSTGDIYFTEQSYPGYVRKVTPEGVVTTIAGRSVTDFRDHQDGPNDVATFESLTGIAVNNAGTIYVADSQNLLIRKVRPDGFVTTVAGHAIDHGWYSRVDGVGAGASVAAYGMAFAPNGILYTADAPSATIRALEPIQIPQLLNLSTRAQVQPGDGVLIGGFISQNPMSKKVMIRAIGPSLRQSGISAALLDPVLELHDATGVIAANDDWKSSQEAKILATGVAPLHDRESAIITTIEYARAYTAVVRGKGAATGVALVEIYDLESTGGSVLANISTRGVVGSSANVMIGGFIVGPSAPTTTQILTRVLGPSLASSGVQNPMQDPALEVRNADGAIVGRNADWKTDAVTQFHAPSYLHPRDDRESLLWMQLQPGAYTAIARDTAGPGGVGLLEIYNLD